MTRGTERRRRGRPGWSRAAAWLAAATLLAGGGGPVRAQTLTTGALEGIVRDATGLPLDDVLITLTHEATGRQQTLRSSRLGRFEARLLSPGEYRGLFERFGFAPGEVSGIVVGSGDRRTLAVELEAADDVVEGVRTATSAGGTATASTAASAWLLGWLGGRLPQDAAALDAVGQLDTRVGRAGEVEGLPASLARPTLDGVPVAPRLSDAAAFATMQAVPLASLGFAEVRTLSPDVEWPGAAAGLFAAQTLTAGGSGRISGLGDFGGDAFAAGGEVASFTEYRVGGRFASRIGGDTALVVLGVDAARSEVPMEPLWAPAVAEAVAGAAVQQGVDLLQYAAPHAVRRERLAAYGLVHYRVSDDHELAVRGRFTQLPRLDLDPLESGSLFGPAFQSNELLASVSLASRMGEENLNEFTAALELGTTERDEELDGLPAAGTARTILVDPGIAFGSTVIGAAESRVRSIYLRDTYHLTAGTHRLKMGGAIGLQHYRHGYDPRGRVEFVFADAGQLAAGRGLFRAEDWNDFPAEFDSREFRLYIQDRWSPAPGVQALVGLRHTWYAIEKQGTSVPHALWLSLTGLVSDTLVKSFRAFEPSFGLEWSLGGGWALSAAAEVDADAAAPALLAELFGDQGTRRGRAAFRVFDDYPAIPGTNDAPQLGLKLTTFGPEYRPPRTSRVGGGLSGAVGAIGLSVAVNHRKTDYLPRRRDVNLPISGLMQDQHGRPIFGELIQQGGSLVARPDRNRRFPEFDRVYAIEVTGESRYTGVTVSTGHSASENLSLFGAWTWSTTTDDWLGAASADPARQLSPFPHPDMALSEWADGTSDFDVPHRALVAAQLRAPGRIAPALAVLYRYQSGYPFTPGFRDGVDVNADGSSRNDPAFIDPALAGGLLGEWSCLQESSGRFAERNSCRGPSYSSLDARLSLDLELGTARARLVLDALNLVASDVGLVDRAVYLIDADQSVTVDAGTGRVTLPLEPNPGFGELLVRSRPQRVLRLGVRVSY